MTVNTAYNCVNMLANKGDVSNTSTVIYQRSCTEENEQRCMPQSASILTVSRYQYEKNWSFKYVNISCVYGKRFRHHTEQNKTTIYQVNIMLSTSKNVARWRSGNNQSVGSSAPVVYRWS